MKTKNDLLKRLRSADQGPHMTVGTEGFTAEQANQLHRDGTAHVWRCECCGSWLVRLLNPTE